MKLVTGIITVGNDISQLFVSIVLSYYTGRGHRPRWIALGIYTVVLYCLMSALPHLLYGPGEDALALTVEYGGVIDINSTQEVISKFLSQTLYRPVMTKSCSLCVCALFVAHVQIDSI